LSGESITEPQQGAKGEPGDRGLAGLPGNDGSPGPKGATGLLVTLHLSHCYFLLICVALMSELNVFYLHLFVGEIYYIIFFNVDVLVSVFLSLMSFFI